MISVYAWEKGGYHHGWRQLYLCLLIICLRYLLIQSNTISASARDSLLSPTSECRQYQSTDQSNFISATTDYVQNRGIVNNYCKFSLLPILNKGESLEKLFSYLYDISTYRKGYLNSRESIIIITKLYALPKSQVNWVNIAGIRDYFTQLIQPKHQDHRNKYELSHKLTNNCQTNQYRVMNIFINSGKPTKHKSVNCWFISNNNNSLLLCTLIGESLEKLFLYYRNTSMYSESNNNREITSDNYKKNNNNNNNKNSKAQPKKSNSQRKAMEADNNPIATQINSKAQPKKSNSQGKAMEVDENPIATLMKVLNQLGIDPAVLNSALANKQQEPIKEPVPPAPPYEPDGNGGSRKRQITEVVISNSSDTTTTTISSQVNPWNINKLGTSKAAVSEEKSSSTKDNSISMGGQGGGDTDEDDV